ncbi:MAG: DUF4221 domain-containing protein [Bacteroidales bacterium]|jgi:hypothetical protein|nr:DUF4221 domain-containing protein [Bacteroidales bacterium]
MQKHKIFIFFLIVSGFILFNSCKETNKQNNFDDIFIQSRDIDFIRPENSEEMFVTQYIKTDTSDYLIYLEQNKNILNFYNFKTGELLFNLKIPFKKKIQSFFVRNLNSIFFTPKYNFELLEYKNNNVDSIFFLDIYNSDASGIIDLYDLGNYLEFLPSVISPLYYQDSLFYISGALDPTMDKNNLRPLYIISNKKNNFFINTKVARFPKEMVVEGKTDYPFDCIVSFSVNNKDEIIVSFSTDHSLYIYQDFVLKKKKECRSSFIKDFPQPIALNQINDMELYENRSNESTVYIGIYYDKNRDVYYRTVKLKVREQSKTLFDINDFMYSIMLIDSNFEVIGEQLFNNKEYLFNSLVVTSEGIMLRKPDDLSGTSHFSVFEINNKYLTDEKNKN